MLVVIFSLSIYVVISKTRPSWIYYCTLVMPNLITTRPLRTSHHPQPASCTASVLKIINKRVLLILVRRHLQHTYQFLNFIIILCTASLRKLAAGRKLAATHLNVSTRQMCGCTGFKSGSYNKSYYNRPFKNDTGL